MNRRKFLKFLGKVTVASGVAVATGLPKVDEIIDNPDIPIELENKPNTIAWDGTTWGSINASYGGVNTLLIDKNGVLYVGGEFTSP